MSRNEAVMKRVQGALEREARVNIHRYPIRMDYQDGAVILEGELEDIAAKKLALERVAALPGVSAVVDRLRVAPGERRGDGAIRDSLVRLLLEVPEFRNCTICARDNQSIDMARDAGPEAMGEIEVAVKEGVILLEGHLESQPHRLFAGVVAWWVPGRRDVLNAIEVRPDYEERDEEVTEALRLALEADPLVNADQIRPNCGRGIVTLEGNVPSEEQRRRAELDAWCMAGVDRVVNRLAVAR